MARYAAKDRYTAHLWAGLGNSPATPLWAAFRRLYLTERIKLLRAGRIEAEKQAHVLVIQDSGQIFIRDTDQSALWRAAHLQQSLYANGHYEQPSDQERLAWQVFITQGRQAKVAFETNLLPETRLTDQNLLDLLTELDKAQRCLIVGASGSGKTTLLKHLVNRRVSTSQVLVIDPHAHPEKWPNCDVVGIGVITLRLNTPLKPWSI